MPPRKRRRGPAVGYSGQRLLKEAPPAFVSMMIVVGVVTALRVLDRGEAGVGERVIVIVALWLAGMGMLYPILQRQLSSAARLVPEPFRRPALSFAALFPAFLSIGILASLLLAGGQP